MSKTERNAAESSVEKNLRPEVILTPDGFLRLEVPVGASKLPFMDAFTQDWRDGLFQLAAEKTSVGQNLTLKFWQEIAREFLAALCHVPSEAEFVFLELPSSERLLQWVEQAPPMRGGEYLTPSRIAILWHHLNLWLEEQVGRKGRIDDFLYKRAPLWKQVGRVCFHLAENKKDVRRPFAFMATYSTGFAASGKLKHLPLKQALEQYAGANNRKALIKLLSPVMSAAAVFPWLQTLIDTQELYQPLAWSVSKAHQFLKSVSQLDQMGVSVTVPNWWKKRSRPQVGVTIEVEKGAGFGIETMLNFKVEAALGDQELTQEELRELCAASEGMALIRGQWVEVDSDKLKEALDHWDSVQKKSNDGQISFIDGMRLLSGVPSSLQAENELKEERSWVQVSAGGVLSDLLAKLRDPSILPLQKAMKDVKATLRPYQKEGVQWLTLLSGLGLGACLADDMGLGKTLQILSLLVAYKKQRSAGSVQPSLLVVPASLLGNWKREAAQFTPSLKLAFVHPSQGGIQKMLSYAYDPQEALQGVDLVITTYSMVVRQEWITSFNWDLLILDEAQAIKNAGTKQSRQVRTLKARSRIALTGTPIENRLSDLWSLFDFLNPGLLGAPTRFKQYIKSMEASGHFEPLKKLISPYILRRMKTDPKIISDLPEKIETPCYCQLTKEQAQYYQSTVDELKKGLRTSEDLARRGLVLQALLRLKQICNHPAQFIGNEDYSSENSGKFARLTALCEELASRQEKVLIFTQFREIIEPLAEHLAGVFGRPGLILHGGTPVKARQTLVEDFQREDGPPFFVLSLKAGGTGLTLTAASHVIHFDRWWNPAVENQATDRAFRIGQKKNVQVHKFITQGTVEEQIDLIIESKRKLATDVLGTSSEVKLTELSDKDLLDLVALDIDRAEIT